MPGFLVGNIGPGKPLDPQASHFVAGESVVDGFYFARATLDKFLAFKPFYVDDDYCVVAEGYISNVEPGDTPDAFARQIISLYEKNGDRFFEDFRGSFSGALYDHRRSRWVVWTNHYGDNTLFYYRDEDDGWAFASQVDWLLSVMKESGLPFELDGQAVYWMLTYGFMADDSTYEKKIRRLLPGSYAVIESGQMTVQRYWRPMEDIQDLSALSDREVLEELDQRFRAAVNRLFSVDRRFGYRHLADLSGGLDSRMVSWVAHEEGYSPVLNIGYAKRGTPDEVVAGEVAAELGNDFLFKQLDDLGFMTDLEAVVRLNYGLAYYGAATGCLSMLRSLSMGDFGLEHTGMIGDVVVGSFVPGELDGPIGHGGLYSTMLVDRLPDVVQEDYANQEQYLMETRAFLGACSSHLIRRHFTEVASPFLDVDLFEYALSIPPSRRYNHRLYREWIRRMHYRAGDFVWEREGLPINRTPQQSLTHGFGRIKSKVGRVLLGSGTTNPNTMNPMDWWLKRSDPVRLWMNGQFQKYKCKLSGHMAEDACRLFEKGTCIEKMQVLTAMCSIRYYRSFGRLRQVAAD